MAQLVLSEMRGRGIWPLPQCLGAPSSTESGGTAGGGAPTLEGSGKGSRPRALGQFTAPAAPRAAAGFHLGRDTWKCCFRGGTGGEVTSKGPCAAHPTLPQKKW